MRASFCGNRLHGGCLPKEVFNAESCSLGSFKLQIYEDVQFGLLNHCLGESLTVESLENGYRLQLAANVEYLLLLMKPSTSVFELVSPGWGTALPL